MPREAVSLKRVVGKLAEGNHLTPDLVLSLESWQKGLENGKFGANARTREEGVLRVRTILGNLEGADQVARTWVMDSRNGVDVESELGLRARLSDEMALCLRQGGVNLPEGGTRQDVPKLVEEVIYQVKPELLQEVDAERKRRENGFRPPQLEGGMPNL
jgi:hypothetical protein